MYNLKDIFIAKDIFKLYLIPGVQIPTINSDSHVGPSDVNSSRPNQFPGVHLIIQINMIDAYKKIEKNIILLR